MKLTNIILAVLLTVTTAQAQIPLVINADSILASTSAITFSEVQLSEEFTEKSGKISSEVLEEIEGNEFSLELPTEPDFVFFAYPSMFTDAIFVTTDVVESSEIQLVNEAGQVVFKQETEGIVENEKFTIPTVLAAGTYFLKIKGKDEASVKLVKRN